MEERRKSGFFVLLAVVMTNDTADFLFGKMFLLVFEEDEVLHRPMVGFSVKTIKNRYCEFFFGKPIGTDTVSSSLDV